MITFLQLNVTKTKELCIDFRRKQTPPKHVCIKGEEVVRDDTYKYMGIVIDSQSLNGMRTLRA